jgi:hypothetical protein
VWGFGGAKAAALQPNTSAKKIQERISAKGQSPNQQE